MFKNIVNPIDNKMVPIKSIEGRKILRNYINKLKGGAEQSTGQSSGEIIRQPEVCSCIGCEEYRIQHRHNNGGDGLLESDFIMDWLREDINRNLDTLPGMTPHLKRNLNNVGITSTQQLIGKYLSLMTYDLIDEDDDEYAELSRFEKVFKKWLVSMGVTCMRAMSLLVMSISRKLNDMGFM